MLHIGELYLQHTDGQCRLCANIALNGKGTTLWFGVDETQEDCLCAERSDAFVMALLPTAMRGGYDITCETPMSQRLRYQLENYLIPTLAAQGDLYQTVSIHAPLTGERVKSKGGVGTGFSGGADCLYTIMTHGKDSEYALTHLAVFNLGAFDGSKYREHYHNACNDAVGFAEEQGLDLIFLDSNIVDVLSEEFLEVYSFRNLAGAMALQGLFSVYLLSSGHAFSELTFDLKNNSTYDLLTVCCAQTESLAVYSSGGQLHRYKKLEALAQWEPAHRWLHPCFRRRLSSGNCGRCKKCIHTMTVLHAYGALDRFQAVFDVDDYRKSFPQHIGYLLAVRENPLYGTPLRLLKENNIPIPPQAYEEEKALRSMGSKPIRTRTEQQDALRALARNLRKEKSREKDSNG